MSYEVTMDGQAVIKRDSIRDAVEALDDRFDTKYADGIAPDDGNAAEVLATALGELAHFATDPVRRSYPGMSYKEGDVSIAERSDDYYGWDDDAEEAALTAIAPFVHDGDAIEITGEDDSHWRYLFRGGKLVQQFPVVKWEDEYTL